MKIMALPESLLEADPKQANKFTRWCKQHVNHITWLRNRDGMAKLGSQDRD